MATKLTFEGVDSTVQLDDHAITLTGAASSGPDPAGDATDGAAPLTIPRWEVDDVTLTSASLVGYGTLVISARGREHTVRFSRDAESAFSDLAALIG